MAKTKSISTGKIALEDMPDALTEILTDFQRSSFDVRQNAVQAGFIRRCFDSTEPQVFDAIKKTIQNGGSNNGK